MKSPDLIAAECAVSRIEAGTASADDLATVAASWRSMRAVNLAMERIIHDAIKDLEAL